MQKVWFLLNGRMRVEKGDWIACRICGKPAFEVLAGFTAAVKPSAVHEFVRYIDTEEGVPGTDPYMAHPDCAEKEGETNAT